MDKHVKALVKALMKPANAVPWSSDDLMSLTALCERADRMEGSITPPWWASPGQPGAPLSQFMEQFTDTGRTKLLADVQAHPIYRRLVADVPLAASLPADSPFDPLRRVRVIAHIISGPMPRKRHKTSPGRPDKRRKSELSAMRRLQSLTSDPERKRILAEWIARDIRRLPVAFGKIAHLTVWRLAFDLWVDAYTADVQLLLQAAQLVDSAGCDDTTARRYIKQAQKIIPKRPRRIQAPPRLQAPPMTGLFGLGAGLITPPADT